MAPRLRGIGHAVQGGDERQLARVRGAGQQVVGVRVVVGPHPQGQALVHRAAGEPVQLGGAGLEDRHAAVGGQLDGLVDPLVAGDPGPDVQHGRGHAGPQRLDHRVAAGHELGRLPRAARGPPGARRGRGRAGTGRVTETARIRSWTRHRNGGIRTPDASPERRDPERSRTRHRNGGIRRPDASPERRTGAGAGRGRALLGGVAGALGGGRRRPLALQLAPALAAGAGARLAGLGAARATAAFAARRRSAAGAGAVGGAQRFSSQRGPCGVSSTITPISSRPSRIASAVA